eukprot:Skav224425  [mRNA]  locus=scaffold657:506646:516782:+ [translate_table: standard]
MPSSNAPEIATEHDPPQVTTLRVARNRPKSPVRTCAKLEKATLARSQQIAAAPPKILLDQLLQPPAENLVDPEVADHPRDLEDLPAPPDPPAVASGLEAGKEAQSEDQRDQSDSDVIMEIHDQADASDFLSWSSHGMPEFEFGLTAMGHGLLQEPRTHEKILVKGQLWQRLKLWENKIPAGQVREDTNGHPEKGKAKEMESGPCQEGKASRASRAWCRAEEVKHWQLKAGFLGSACKLGEPPELVQLGRPGDRPAVLSQRCPPLRLPLAEGTEGMEELPVSKPRSQPSAVVASADPVRASKAPESLETLRRQCEVFRTEGSCRHLCAELCYFREFEAARQQRALQDRKTAPNRHGRRLALSQKAPYWCAWVPSGAW